MWYRSENTSPVRGSQKHVRENLDFLLVVDQPRRSSVAFRQIMLNPAREKHCRYNQNCTDRKTGVQDLDHVDTDPDL
jgi:hypothetical protein